MNDMDDAEFLNYALGMADTPRCGFVPSQIARLYRLAGDEDKAALWDKEPNQVIDADRHGIRKLVALAEARRCQVPTMENKT